jgi:hypothetical protein
MSEESLSLSSVFEGMPFGGKAEATPEPAKPAVEIAPEPKAPETPAKPAETTPAATQVEKPAEKPRVDVAAIMDERRKRQALEAKLKELESKPEAKTSVFDDEDKAISSRVEAGTRGLREMLYKQSLKTARILYKDTFADAEAAFIDAANADPEGRLIDGLRASDDPGEYIHTIGMQIKELGAPDVAGDFIKYREKLTAESKTQMATLQAQLDALKTENEALKKAQTDLEAIPRSLNTTSLTPAKAGDEDEADIKTIVRFGNKKR